MSAQATTIATETGERNAAKFVYPVTEESQGGGLEFVSDILDKISIIDEKYYCN